MCVPGWTQSARTTGSRDGVVVTTSCDARTAVSTSGATETSMPCSARISVAYVSAPLRDATTTRCGRAHAEQRLELVARLSAGADDRRLLDLGGREQVGGERSRGAGAQLGEVAVVEAGSR